MRKSNFDTKNAASQIGAGSLLALMLGLILAGPAAAAKDRSIPKFDRYRDCVREVSIDAEHGYNVANRWRTNQGGAPAMHCEAMALSGMGAYSSAAKLLERLARLDEVSGPMHKADILLQAGHAWILADRSQKAQAAFDDGLTRVDLNSQAVLASDLMVGRAHALGLEDKWAEAESDLNLVLAVLPQQFDALLLRASMRRAQGDYSGASADLANYLTLLPDEVDGLMERGFLRMDILDLSGAQADFDKVLELAPESHAALQAHRELSKIAFRQEQRRSAETP